MLPLPVSLIFLTIIANYESCASSIRETKILGQIEPDKGVDIFIKTRLFYEPVKLDIVSGKNNGW
jgi:hypothetical protein